jgi:hypothetical protein
VWEPELLVELTGGALASVPFEPLPPELAGVLPEEPLPLFPAAGPWLQAEPPPEGAALQATAHERAATKSPEMQYKEERRSDFMRQPLIEFN